MNLIRIRIRKQSIGVSSRTYIPAEKEDLTIFISDCKIMVRDKYVVN
jgi:hypothetical protein